LTQDHPYDKKGRENSDEDLTQVAHALLHITLIFNGGKKNEEIVNSFSGNYTYV